MNAFSHPKSVRACLLAASGLAAFSLAGLAHAQAPQIPPVANPASDPAARPSDPVDPAASGVTSSNPFSPDNGAPASAPANAVATQAAPGGGNEIVVTGIRKSLQSATNAKRAAVGFTDSIFAEDIGKLPATNLAETLNRIPGVKLARDINGEGVQVSIRGLGPSFSKVLLNNTQIAIASDGGTTGFGGGNREVDLDLFPSELFTRLDVLKSPVASTLEGGIAGTVNLRNARPFDTPGTHVTVVGQAQYSDSNGKAGPRGAIVASHTFGDTFGVLVGVAGLQQKSRIDGFETVGWTDGNIPTGVAGRADAGGNGFIYAPTVPANTGFGLVPGAPVDLAATSGVPLDVLRTALIPRLARNSLTTGTRSRISTLLALEWRPSDRLHFAFDGLYAYSKRDFTRLNMNWYVRNSAPGTSPTSTGGMVPIDLTVDPNGVVTNGTFANSSFFLEADVFNQTTKFWNVNPSMTWQPTDTLKIDAQVNYGRSTFFREQPQFDFQTPPQSGLNVFFDNTNGNPQPVITTNRDLGDPNLGWRWYRVNVQNVERKTNTKGAHFDVTWGSKDVNLKAGAAYDEAFRSIQAFDNSVAFQTAVCGATCDGTTGSVPNSQVSQYLQRLSITDFGHLANGPVGYTSFIQPDLSALEQATNYASFRDNAPVTSGAVTGGAVGNIREKTFGGYVELNGLTQILDRDLRINVGVRYFHTDQFVEGPIQVGNTFSTLSQKASYNDWLPSFNLTYDVTRRLKLRASASRAVTRADAGSLLPGLTFSDTSAQVATRGNPNLKPYTSNNIDLGGEYYTGGIGYVGVSYFRKDIDGFTAIQQSTVPFNSLGIDFNTLQTTQRDAINSRGGPDAALIFVNQPVNLQKLLVRGVEVTWVQPLDFLVKGLGFSANGTRITQSSSDGLFAPGIAPWSYNIQGFYENHGISISLNYVWNDKNVSANGPQNNVNVPLVSDARGQLDLSAGYQLPWLNKAFRLTFDALNLTNQPIRTYFGYSNAAYSTYYPGRQFLMGVRAKF
ncbi:TonB-dependent receptor [Sphingomonas morindae]|uniref:TonB-dependent receptor n=1 Tax=Sphingomonas morindae TaxID=1541170 RepID=A0ABY4X6E0_9SPHN|nr:TonB-dependent receptor [Sphingomonas morindae]USI72437.1 TonB-dependent receptor [Sphingomonas morindae]